MAKTKIATKKMLREPDEFQSITHRIWDLVQDNPGKTAGVFGGIVAVILVAILATHLVERSHRRAVNAAADAIEAYLDRDAEGRDPATLAGRLGELATQHGDEPLGASLRYYQGVASAEAGEYDRAIELFESIPRDYPSDSTAAVMARVAAAYAYRARGELPRAVEEFESLLDRNDVAVPRAQIRLELGAIHEELGESDAAAEVYRALIDAAPESDWSATAEERLRRIKGDAKSAS